MSRKMLPLLMMLASSVAVQSCASKTEIHLALPPVADLAQQAEPAYPVEALTDPAAEEAWNNKVLIWGRAGWAQNARVCSWAVDLGLPVPAGYCTAKPTP